MPGWTKGPWGEPVEVRCVHLGWREAPKDREPDFGEPQEGRRFQLVLEFEADEPPNWPLGVFLERGRLGIVSRSALSQARGEPGDEP